MSFSERVYSVGHTTFPGLVAVRSNFLPVNTSALFDDGGQEVVYVMLGGERFQRRTLCLGIHDGDWVQTKTGHLSYLSDRFKEAPYQFRRLVF